MTMHLDPVSIFISSIDKDKLLLRKLETHLSLLKRQGLISTWDNRQIVPGTDRVKEIDQRLEQASIILLMVSADFLASDYCYEMEIQRALQRHKAGQARVIPIIIRPVDWKSAPFAHLQPLPTTAKAITTWSNQDEAWVDVAQGIRKALEESLRDEGKKEAPDSYMSFMDGFVAQVLPGIDSTVGYDLLKAAWERYTQHSWQKLYLDAIQLACDEAKPILARYVGTDDGITLNQDALLQVLRQDFSTAPEAQPHSKLPLDRFLSLFATAMQSHSVIEIDDNHLPSDGYSTWIGTIVLHAHEMFRKSVYNDMPLFNRVLQETVEANFEVRKDATALLENIRQTLDTKISLKLRLLHQVTEEQENYKRENKTLVQFVQQRADSTATRPRKIRVFLSSPSDVNTERKNAQLVCERLQRDAVLKLLIELEIVAWDCHEGVVLLASQTPQHSVNLQLPLPAECDIVVVMLWSRMGTPISFSEFKKPDGTAYLSGTEWEFYDAVRESKRSGFLPIMLVYRRIQERMVGLHDPQKAEIEQQQILVDEFFDSLSTPDGAMTSGYNRYATQEEFQNNLEAHLRQAIALILKRESHPQAVQIEPVETVTDPEWNEPPFPGLRTFTRNDAPIYFGREQEIGELVTRVQDNRLTAVVGASGSGKSSLVWAGLVPRLADNVEVVRFTPAEISDDPFVAMATAMTSMLREKYGRVEMKANDLWRELSNETTSLDEICVRVLPAEETTSIEADGEPPQPKELLIFIDQFEELFTLVKTSSRDAFVRAITQAQGAQHFRVILTMRAEFYHECLKWENLSQLLQKGGYPLSAPGLQALYRMIVEPARIAGFLFDRDLPEMILVDASINPGTLPLMAYALRELYDYSKLRNDHRLMLSDYQEIGGLAGAIGKVAQRLFPALSDAQQGSLYTVFLKLLTVNDQGVVTRKRANRDGFTPSQLQLIDRLIEGRLLVSGADNKKDTTIEVAHEALFSSWNVLSEWLTQTRDQQILVRQMREAVMNWKKATPEQRDGLLWHGERLKNANAAIDCLQIRGQLTQDEAEFLLPEVERLVEKLMSVSLTHDDREDIGHQLNRIDDTRLGVGLQPDGLPDIKWFKVSAGEVHLDGVDHVFVIDPFYISRYTVTYRQFQAFVDDLNGIQNMDWWNPLERSYPDIARQRFRYDNYPRTHVNWFQSVAFCHWLNAKLPKANLSDGGQIDWTIRLPCEWEWQQVGYGGQVGASYPWGGWKEGEVLCNDQESEFNKPIAVGMYPHGNAFGPQGVSDMLGNVAQWCHNCFENPLETGLKGMKRRAVRGCDFSQSAISANLTFRSALDPAKIEDAIGFRVVYAPIRNLSV
jgi:formylglycine-generating enzyme required for sulfatase activity